MAMQTNYAEPLGAVVILNTKYHKRVKTADFGVHCLLLHRAPFRSYSHVCIVTLNVTELLVNCTVQLNTALQFVTAFKMGYLICF